MSKTITIPMSSDELASIDTVALEHSLNEEVRSRLREAIDEKFNREQCQSQAIQYKGIAAQ